MKKALLLLAAVAALVAAQAQPKHIEPYWHGLYGVAGYDFATNVKENWFLPSTASMPWEDGKSGKSRVSDWVSNS